MTIRGVARQFISVASNDERNPRAYLLQRSVSLAEYQVRSGRWVYLGKRTIILL